MLSRGKIFLEPEVEASGGIQRSADSENGFGTQDRMYEGVAYA